MYKEMIVVNDIHSKDEQFIYELWQDNRWDSLNMLGEGVYGEVYEYKNFAIKVFKKNENYFNKDPYILKVLNNKEYFPELFMYVENEFMVLEKIEGIQLNTFKNDTSVMLNEEFLYYLENALRYILLRGLIPKDMHSANIMVTPECFPVIVDVGGFEFINHNFNNEEYLNNSMTKLSQDIAMISELQYRKQQKQQR